MFSLFYAFSCCRFFLLGLHLSTFMMIMQQLHHTCIMIGHKMMFDQFLSIEFQANMIDNIKASSRRRRAHMDTDKVAVLSSWRRVDCRTREALRRSFLFELIEGYEVYSCLKLLRCLDIGQVLTCACESPCHCSLVFFVFTGEGH